MNPSRQSLFPQIGLPPEQFAAAFPFHLAMDRELRLVQAGATIRRICPDVQPGASLAQIFRSIRPEGAITVEWLLQNSLRFFLLEHLASKLQLRGEFILVHGEETLLFLGSPWFTDTAEIAERGLSFDDFAIHDPGVDMLQVYQANKIALADAKKLATKLTAQRAELRAANERLRQQEAETRTLALIAARTDNAVVLTDAAGLVVWVNEGFTRLTGYTLPEMLGKKPGTVLQGPGTDAETVRRIGERLRKGEGFSEEILNYGKDGRSYWLAVEVQPIHDDAGRLTNFMAIEIDITARRAAQQRLAIQFEVSRVLAEVNNLATAVPQVLQAICETLGWQVGQLWRVVGERLRFVDVWHPASAPVAEFISASRAVEFRRAMGLPGEVWATAKPRWIRDVTGHANFPRGAIAAREGLRGAFGFPILVRGEIWGVAEFFSRNLEAPDEALLQTFVIVGNQIGQFIVRRAAEEALLESNTLQQAILEGSNYSIISTTPEGIILTFNAAAERMLGYTSEEMVGKLTPALLHDLGEVTVRAAELTRELGRTIEPGFEAFVAKAALGKPDEREWTYIRKDGSRFPVLLSVTALFDERGKVTGYLGVASDITERKRAEAEVKLQKTYLELLLDQSPVAVAVLDNNDYVLRINHAFTRLFGYESSEAAGRKINDLVAPENLLAEVFQVSARGMAGERLDLETVRRARDGTLRSVRLLGQHIVVDGQKVASLATYIDVSAQKQVEADLIKARQAAEAANRAKSEFLAVMSHEIRTPMNAVLGMTNLLLESPLQPKQREFAHSVARSGEALIEIINDILDFSKIEAGEHLLLEEEVFSLHRLVEDVVQLLRTRAAAGGLALTMEFAPDLPDTVKSDGGRLRQVLVNLVGNAIKFTDQGGVAVRVQCVKSEARRVQLRFEVQDSGIGMTSADLARLFQPFTQVDSSASRRRGGTGLGLAISKRIVELMGGRIGVESTPGQGSLFWFELAVDLADAPVAEVVSLDSGATADREVLASATPSPSPDHPLRILVAEDHDTNRRLAMFMLEKLSYRADFAGNGREAVEAWERFDHDVILMDCQMPEMDGFEATREIRRRETARNSARRVRIIALTANALKGDRERCLAAGMDGYISKPFTLEQLREVLEPHAVRPVQASPSPAIPSAASASGFDRQRVSQFCEELGDEGVLGIVQDFLNDLPQRAVEMQSLAAAGRLPELARLSHSLQGIGRTVGLTGFSEKLLSLEHAANAADQNAIAQTLRLLPAEVEQGIASLQGWLATRRG